MKPTIFAFDCDDSIWKMKASGETENDFVSTSQMTMTGIRERFPGIYAVWRSFYNDLKRTNQELAEYIEQIYAKARDVNYPEFFLGDKDELYKLFVEEHMKRLLPHVTPESPRLFDGFARLWTAIHDGSLPNTRAILISSSQKEYIQKVFEVNNLPVKEEEIVASDTLHRYGPALQGIALAKPSPIPLLIGIHQVTEGTTHPATLDNLAKITQNGINGIVFGNDSEKDRPPAAILHLPYVHVLTTEPGVQRNPTEGQFVMKPDYDPITDAFLARRDDFALGISTGAILLNAEQEFAPYAFNNEREDPNPWKEGHGYPTGCRGKER